MTDVVTWALLLVLCCGCTGKHSSVPSVDGSGRTAAKQVPHIHKHNGDLTSVRSSNIIKEEGMYFLRKLVKKYGKGLEMDIFSLEAFLENLGYVTHGTDSRGLVSGRRDRNHSYFGRNESLVEGSGGHGGLTNDDGKVEGTHADKNKHSYGNRTGIDQGDEEEAHVGPIGNGNDKPSKSRHSHESGGRHLPGETHDEEAEDKDDVFPDGQGKKEETDIVNNDKSVNGETGNGMDSSGSKRHSHLKGNRDHGKNAQSDNRDDEVHDVADGEGVRAETTDMPLVSDANVDEGKQRMKTRHGRRKHRKNTEAERSGVAGHKRQRTSDEPPDQGPEIRKRSTGSVIFHTHDTHTDCMTAEQLIKIFHFDKQQKISQSDLLYISPAIVYQLSKPHCRPSRLRGPDQLPPASNDTESAGDPAAVYAGISAHVWGYSALAVFVISLVGLLGVAVIPIMQNVFYNQLLQFLVAMAVGALTGDAMLHLLPHAIAGEGKAGDEGGHEEHEEHDLGPIWKGLCGLMGIYFFFIIQRLLTIVTRLRKKKRDRKAQRRLANKAGAAKTALSSDSEYELIVSAPTSAPVTPDLEQSHPLKPANHEAGHSTGHGHSHHSGPLPTSVSAMAWMIILGDGIHNFSDGLAIGAAFSNTITGGFSTSIAVFCHELPHEIGDFAVLLKSGMSVKHAIMYNVVSSVLCLVGMVIGVALGNIEDASSWIFAAVGGMFIYISLVTMIPELTSVVSDKPVRDLVLQCTGICTGAGIMLIIAIYEDDLKKSLG